MQRQLQQQYAKALWTKMYKQEWTAIPDATTPWQQSQQSTTEPEWWKCYPRCNKTLTTKSTTNNWTLWHWAINNKMHLNHQTVKLIWSESRHFIMNTMESPMVATTPPSATSRWTDSMMIPVEPPKCKADQLLLLTDWQLDRLLSVLAHAPRHQVNPH